MNCLDRRTPEGLSGPVSLSEGPDGYLGPGVFRRHNRPSSTRLIADKGHALWTGDLEAVNKSFDGMSLLGEQSQVRMPCCEIRTDTRFSRLRLNAIHKEKRDLGYNILKNYGTHTGVPKYSHHVWESISNCQKGCNAV